MNVQNASSPFLFHNGEYYLKARDLLEGFEGVKKAFLSIEDHLESVPKESISSYSFGMDRKIEVPLPNQEERVAMIEVHMRKMKLPEELSLGGLAEKMEGYSGARVANVCKEVGLRAFSRLSSSQEDFSSMELLPVTEEDFSVVLSS